MNNNRININESKKNTGNINKNKIKNTIYINN